MMMAGDSPTPPHHPTFSVHLSEQQIQDIFQTIFGDVKILGIEQLQRGDSFNNRIYFISAVTASVERRFALKVSGHFFSGRKVENEVACLALLGHYCPDIPIPSVVAWSLDGTMVESSPSVHGVTGDETIHTVSAVLEGRSEQTRSWIVLDKLPGTRLAVDESNVEDQRYGALMRQLAGHVNSWRTKIPRRRQFGNLRLERQNSESSNAVSFKVNVAGLILCDNTDENCRIQTKRDYFLERIENAMRAVKDGSSFPDAHYRQMQRVVRPEELQQRLDGLAIVRSPADLEASFTHYDFAPRNMLVTIDEKTGNLQVSGILDFEFAGFFPVEEEFTNDVIGNEGDWPSHLYQTYLDELERLNCQVPVLSTEASKSRTSDNSLQEVHPKGTQFSPEQWREAVLLAQLIDNIAPWRVAAGYYKGDEIEAKLAEATEQVQVVSQRLFDGGEISLESA